MCDLTIISAVSLGRRILQELRIFCNCRDINVIWVMTQILLNKIVGVFYEIDRNDLRVVTANKCLFSVVFILAEHSSPLDIIHWQTHPITGLYLYTVRINTGFRQSFQLSHATGHRKLALPIHQDPTKVTSLKTTRSMCGDNADTVQGRDSSIALSHQHIQLISSHMGDV